LRKWGKKERMRKGREGKERAGRVRRGRVNASINHGYGPG